MKNYLLVHGAWHGEWCWEALLNPLRQFVQVYTVNYPAKPSTDVSIEDYVMHILQMIENIEGDVILVGHSFAGFIISEVASRCHERISELIYINGFIPIPQESLWNVSAILSSQHLTPYLVIDEKKQELFIEPASVIESYMYNRTLKDKIPFQRLRPEPLKPLTEIVMLSDNFVDIPKRAIISNHDLTLSTADQILMCDRYQMPYQLMDADHCPFISAPFKLLELIYHKG